jgi:hypothetical protein
MPGLSSSPPILPASTVKALAADVGPITAQTTLQTLTGLVIPITASATGIWFFEAFLLVSAANAAMDAKFGWSLPAGCTMQHGAVAGLGSEMPGFGDRSVGNARSLLNNESGTTQVATAAGTTGSFLAGMILGGGTAGNAQLQYAQNTSDAGNLTILKGSFLRYTQLVA